MNRALVIAQTTWLEMLRKKDVYVLFILLGVMLVTLVSLNIFGLGGLVVYVKDIGLLMTWLFGLVLAVNISSRGLPQEEQRGTIFPLLAKPITRFELILGKWLGAWVVTSLSLLMFYLLIAVVVALRGGALSPMAMAQGYILHAATLAILCAIALLFSTRMNADATAATSYVVAAAAFLVTPQIPAFLKNATGFSADAFLALYHVLPHFEILDMRNRLIYDQGPAEWRAFVLALAYAACYTVALLLAAWLAYRAKRFSRADIG
ncbi:MAG: ABC transporter permease [Verrucomicrobiota bacterium]|nr:ABC transporter permease [Verrucomicrobiota bacterium]